MNLTMEVSLDAEHIAAGLRSKEVVEYVKAIDLACGDWDVTLALADHFEKLRAEHAKEAAEDRAKLHNKLQVKEGR